MLRPRRRTLVGAGSVALALVIWQLAGSSSSATADAISRPSQLVAVGMSMLASWELASHVLVSLQELAYGFLAAVAVGTLAGVLMGHCLRIRYLCEPLIMALYTVPRIALIPLLVLWFGVGMGSKVAVAFLGGVFPILVNTVAGVKQIDRLWIRSIRSFGASPFQVLAMVTLPGCLPAVMVGIRLGLGRAIIGVIVGEMYVSLAGVGQLIQVYGAAGRTAELIVLAGLISVFGVLSTTALRRLGEWLGGWEPREEL